MAIEVKAGEIKEVLAGESVVVLEGGQAIVLEGGWAVVLKGGAADIQAGGHGTVEDGGHVTVQDGGVADVRPGGYAEVYDHGEATGLGQIIKWDPSRTARYIQAGYSKAEVEDFRKRLVRPPKTPLGKGTALAKENAKRYVNNYRLVGKVEHIEKYEPYFFLKEHGLLGASEPEYTTSIDEGNQGIAPTI